MVYAPILKPKEPLNLKTNPIIPWLRHGSQNQIKNRFIPRILINYLNHRDFKARDQRLNAPETDPVKPYAMI